MMMDVVQVSCGMQMGNKRIQDELGVVYVVYCKVWQWYLDVW